MSLLDSQAPRGQSYLVKVPLKWDNVSKNRLNKGFFTLFSGVAFEQMEFWHQECAKGGIIGYPPYQHIHYLILGP